MPFLSEAQRRLVAFALSFLAIVTIAVLFVSCIALFGRFLSHFSGILWPLAVAGIAALILRPCVDWLERLLHLRRLSAVIVLYVLFLLALSGLLMTVLPPLITQVVEFFTEIPALWAKALAYLNQHYPEWIALARRHLENPAIRQVVDSLGGELKSLLAQAVPSIKAAGGGLLTVAGFLAQLAIVPIYLFFFLLSRAEPTAKLANHLPFITQSLRDDLVFLAREFVQIVVAFFRGQLLISLIMGVLFALGYSLVGLKFGLFLGLACGLLNIIPYLGTMFGLVTTLPLAFLQPEGGWQLVGLVMLVNLIVQAFEGWFLTPKIMGHQTGLHPATIIFALFFWGLALGGLLGMVLAIPLTAFFVTAWRLAKHKYLKVEG